MDMLIQMEGKGKQDKGVYLVSNGKADVDAADQYLIETMADSMHTKELQLTVL
jgi:ABC-type phosphate/phosphonate transport system substrate-binding protein